MKRYIHINSRQTFTFLGKRTNLFGVKVFTIKNEKTGKEYDYLINGLEKYFREIK